jgi:hypothetical protein
MATLSVEVFVNDQFFYDFEWLFYYSQNFDDCLNALQLKIERRLNLPHGVSFVPGYVKDVHIHGIIKSEINQEAVKINSLESLRKYIWPLKANKKTISFSERTRTLGLIRALSCFRTRSFSTS